MDWFLYDSDLRHERVNDMSSLENVLWNKVYLIFLIFNESLLALIL